MEFFVIWKALHVIIVFYEIYGENKATRELGLLFKEGTLYSGQEEMLPLSLGLKGPVVLLCHSCLS